MNNHELVLELMRIRVVINDLIIKILSEEKDEKV